MVPQIGQQIGSYRIVSEIAHGAYAYVYKATHCLLINRIVAIKLLHTAFIDPGAAQDVLTQEAHILEQLKHPHILALIDSGTYEGLPYIVKEYAPNGSLRDRLRTLRGQPLPLNEAVAVLHQIGEGLQFAHTHKVVHCDLKPENILFNAQNEAVIADFDIARVLKTVRSHVAGIGGTPSYMAPEQSLGKVYCASDQYALGCIAYELVTGRRPFEGDSSEILKQKHLHEEPIAPSHVRPDLPPAIERAILRAMDKTYTARFKDVAAFIDALGISHVSPAPIVHAAEAVHRPATPAVQPSSWANSVPPRQGKRLILHPRGKAQSEVGDSIFYEETVSMNADATIVDAPPVAKPRKRTPTKKSIVEETPTKSRVKASAAKTPTVKAVRKPTTKVAKVVASADTQVPKKATKLKAAVPAAKKTPVKKSTAPDGDAKPKGAKAAPRKRILTKSQTEEEPKKPVVKKASSTAKRAVDAKSKTLRKVSSN